MFEQDLIWLWVKTVLGSHFGVGEFTTQILEPIVVVGLNRMFTGGTIWILTHGHIETNVEDTPHHPFDISVPGSPLALPSVSGPLRPLSGACTSGAFH